MRLYHYLETRWALDDIKRRRLKISTITDLNDPYELESVYSDDLLTQAALDKSKCEVVNRLGVVCFSQCWNSVLMWSHYADRHKGMCLGFEVADEITRPVAYVPTPTILGNLVVANKAEFQTAQGESVVNQILGEKYDGWSYEKEVGIHARRADRDKATGCYFWELNDRVVLREVIVGARCSSSKANIEGALANYPDRITSGSRRFGRQQLSSKWWLT